jgi:hypothetical protein
MEDDIPNEKLMDELPSGIRYYIEEHVVWGK